MTNWEYAVSIIGDAVRNPKTRWAGAFVGAILIMGAML